MNDKERLEHIFKHYDELCFELKTSHDVDEKYLKKAIYMDIFQIGEHVSHLSKEALSKLDHNDVRGVVAIRNYIGHGYTVLKEKYIDEVIDIHLPRLIEQLKELFKWTKIIQKEH